MPDLILATCSFMLIYLGPGYLLTRCLRPLNLPSLSTIPAQILSSYLFSYWLIFLPGLYLAKTHHLDAPHALLIITIELFLLFVLKLVLHRALVTNHLGAERGARSINIWLIITLILVAAFHLREIQLSATVRGGFFYFSEVKYFIESSGIPNRVYHFAQPIIPQVDKFGFDIVTSFYWLLGPANPILLNKVAYFFTVIIGAIAAFEFFLLFSSALFSMLAAVLLYANYYFVSVVMIRSFFIPESTAFIFLLIACYFFFFGTLRKLLLSRILWASLFSGLAIAACALQHLEVALYAPLLLTVFTILHLLFSRNLSFLLKLIPAGVLALLLFLLSYTMLGIKPEFAGGESGREAYQPFNGSDPTWEYFSLGSSHLKFDAGPVYPSLVRLTTEILSSLGKLFQEISFTASFGFILVMLSLLLLRRCFVFSKRTSGWYHGVLLGVSSLIVIAVVIILAYIADHHYHVFVYQTEVVRRVAPYLAVFLLIVLFAAVFSLSDRSPQETDPRWIGVLSVIFVIFTGFCFVQSFPLSAPLKASFATTAAGVRTLQWLKAQQEKEPGTVLSNYITNGAFFVLSDKIAVLEGHQPVLRPTLLTQTLDEITKAQAFFKNPRQEVAMLRNWNVRYVVFKTSWQQDFGGIPLFEESAAPKSEKALEEILCRVKTIEDIQVFSICG